MQAESLHSEKRALDKQLEYCQQEIADSERRLKAAQVSAIAKIASRKCETCLFALCILTNGHKLTMPNRLEEGKIGLLDSIQ